jgi:hypothetical protein
MTFKGEKIEKADEQSPPRSVGKEKPARKEKEKKEEDKKSENE